MIKKLIEYIYKKYINSIHITNIMSRSKHILDLNDSDDILKSDSSELHITDNSRKLVNTMPKKIKKESSTRSSEIDIVVLKKPEKKSKISSSKPVRKSDTSASTSSSELDIVTKKKSKTNSSKSEIIEKDALISKSNKSDVIKKKNKSSDKNILIPIPLLTCINIDILKEYVRKDIEGNREYFDDLDLIKIINLVILKQYKEIILFKYYMIHDNYRKKIRYKNRNITIL